MSEQPDVLTVPEVARLLRCSKAHIYKAIRGQIPGVPPIPSVQLGRRMLVLRRSLVTWLVQNQQVDGSGRLRTSLEIDAVRRA